MGFQLQVPSQQVNWMALCIHGQWAREAGLQP